MELTLRFKKLWIGKTSEFIYKMGYLLEVFAMIFIRLHLSGGADRRANGNHGAIMIEIGHLSSGLKNADMTIQEILKQKERLKTLCAQYKYDSSYQPMQEAFELASRAEKQIEIDMRAAILMKEGMKQLLEDHLIRNKLSLDSALESLSSGLRSLDTKVKQAAAEIGAPLSLDVRTNDQFQRAFAVLEAKTYVLFLSRFYEDKTSLIYQSMVESHMSQLAWMLFRDREYPQSRIQIFVDTFPNSILSPLLSRSLDAARRALESPENIQNFHIVVRNLFFYAIPTVRKLTELFNVLVSVHRSSSKPRLNLSGTAELKRDYSGALHMMNDLETIRMARIEAEQVARQNLLSLNLRIMRIEDLKGTVGLIALRLTAHAFGELAEVLKVSAQLNHMLDFDYSTLNMLLTLLKAEMVEGDVLKGVSV